MMTPYIINISAEARRDIQDTYKNMTIIYNLIGEVVLVRRVIASSMVL